MRWKNIHWQRLRTTTLTPEERLVLKDNLTTLGQKIGIRDWTLKTLINQIEDDMERRRKNRNQ